MVVHPGLEISSVFSFTLELLTFFYMLFYTRMPNGVKMTPSDSWLLRIFSPACLQGKSSRDFSSSLGPKSLLEWHAFMSTLNMIF